MIKQVLNQLNYSTLAETALILFVVAFGLVIVHTLLRKSKDVKEAARLPLDDN